MVRQNIASGSAWEDIVGYSRIVRIGNIVEVAGTVANNQGQLVAKGKPYEQAKFIIQKIEKYLGIAGLSLEDIVRTRIYIAKREYWEEVGEAHGEYFRAIKPASTMIVAELISPDYLVEIEATAYIRKED